MTEEGGTVSSGSKMNDMKKGSLGEEAHVTSDPKMHEDQQGNSHPENDPAETGTKKVVTTRQEEEHRRSIEFEKEVKAIFNDGEIPAPEKRARLRRPKLIYGNTYQLEPAKVFSREKVTTVIEQTLTDSLEGMKYSSTKASAVSCALAETIRNRVMEFDYDRYKIIVFVNVGPKARQGVEIGMKCLWDPTVDCHAHGTFESYHIFASAVVYGIYYD